MLAPDRTIKKGLPTQYKSWWIAFLFGFIVDDVLRFFQEKNDEKSKINIRIFLKLFLC